MVMGAPPADVAPSSYEDRLLTVGPPLFMMMVILVLGVWPPQFLVALLKDGAAMLGGQP
jgi:hydrogenase-4 component F